MSFGFNPKNWAQCNGQLLPIALYTPLYSLLGTTYGGDGNVNFGLPDLRGRVPMHFGAGHARGERAGEQAHTLTINELPQHTHAVRASTQAAGDKSPANDRFASAAMYQAASVTAGRTTLHPGTLPYIGGGQAHLNMQPYTVLNFCIAITGIYPGA